MSRIVFTAIGSLGDLHPMLPVAINLRQRGHQVAFVVPDNLREIVGNEGFPNASIPIPVVPNTNAAHPPLCRSRTHDGRMPKR